MALHDRDVHSFKIGEMEMAGDLLQDDTLRDLIHGKHLTTHSGDQTFLTLGKGVFTALAREPLPYLVPRSRRSHELQPVPRRRSGTFRGDDLYGVPGHQFVAEWYELAVDAAPHG